AAAAGLDRLPPEVAELVRRAKSSDPGDWLLHPVSPAEASVLYGLSLDRPATLLVHEAKVSGQGDGSAGANVPAEEDDRFGRDARTPTVFAQYIAEDPEEFARVLERDLRRIYTWENTWRVAASYSAAGEPAVRLTVSDPARPDESLPDGRPLMVGRIAQMTLANDDLRPRWVTALNLQPDYTIASWFTVAVEPGDELGPFQFEVVGETGGPEGILVFSAPVETRRARLDLSYLEQEGFGGAERERSIRSASPAADPLDRLLQAAASGGRMRAALRLNAARPEAVAWTFITVLPPQRPAASPAAESKTEAP
ncbi:hypothetical protein, partial [Alienimonas sp. DA493]|uniref:hypothetical protein n=1 Tax=Alienimonas sp. DA493 TaxID=3373605 RepID=UPI003754F414